MRTEEIRIDLIDPREDQPRQSFDAEALDELRASIEAEGVVNPVTVRAKPDGRYDLLAGHRRRLASIDAGLETIPATIHEEMTDRTADKVTLLDNLAREDLLPWEEGRGYANLADRHGLEIDEMADEIGRPVRTVRSRLRIHDRASEAAREAYQAGEIGTESLDILCDLPPEPVEVVECPECDMRTRDADECPRCGHDLSFVLGSGGTDLQALALQQAAGAGVGVMREIVATIRRQYGLADDGEAMRTSPAQSNMGLAVEEIDPEALRAKKKLEEKLGQIGAIRDWAVEKQDALEGTMPAHTARSLLQQLQAAGSALQQVADIVTRSVEVGEVPDAEQVWAEERISIETTLDLGAAT